MRSMNKFSLCSLICLLLLFLNCSSKPKSEMLSDYEFKILKICEGVIQLFKQQSGSIWPGYDLSEISFIVYIPGKWTLLFNTNIEIDPFASYPEDWPELGTAVLYHKGPYKGLVGQLAFNFEVGDFKTVAIGFPEEFIESVSQPELRIFGTIIHEAFHQYQFEHFGEIPWAREELYPIHFKRNSALAYLEMRLLMDALLQMKNDDKERCREYMEQFIAVRNDRWKHGDPFVAHYEQGMEINEGTARYVEMKSIDLMSRSGYESSLKKLTSPLKENSQTFSMPDLLIRDFHDRMKDNFIAPEDMLRNRIYPVGSAQGFLLDYFGIDWKGKAQQAGTEFTFMNIFKEALNIDERTLEQLLVKAKKTYGYDKILFSTGESIKRYLEGYQKELDRFESQSGYRIEIAFAYKSISRSRMSQAKKWIIGKGKRTLCSNYEVYTLRSDDLSFELHHSGLLEEDDWNAKKKKLIFYTPENLSIKLDDELLEAVKDSPQQFENVEMSGTSFKFISSKEGIISSTQNIMRINLIQ